MLVKYDEMNCVNNQNFEFHYMQLNWSIYRT